MEGGALVDSRGWKLLARLILVGVLMLPATIPSAFAGDSQLEPLVENALVEGEIGFEAAELVVDPLIGTDTPVGGSEPPGVE